MDSRISLNSKRRAILLDSEIRDLYGAPKLTFEQKRYYLSLNDLELDALRSIHDRYNGLYFVLLRLLWGLYMTASNAAECEGLSSVVSA